MSSTDEHSKLEELNPRFTTFCTHIIVRVVISGNFSSLFTCLTR